MAELSKIKFNGAEYDLKDAIAREAIENLPEDKIFPVNVTLTSATEGTSDKTHTEILAAVNAGKIPVAYGTFGTSKLVINLAFADPSGAKFIYLDQRNPTIKYAELVIIDNNVTILATNDTFAMSDDIDIALSSLATVATSGSYNDLSDTPTIPTTTSELINNSDFITNADAAFFATKDEIPDISNLASKDEIPTATSDLTNDNGFITSSDLPDTSTFMVKGTDYVTAGKKVNTTLGSRATTEGIDTTASGDGSHAEGYHTIASNYYSHAEGASTTASGAYSHAEGSTTTASGYSSHAEGYNTTASGYYCHAEGAYTTAQRKSQHTFGEYNIADTTGTTSTRGTYIEIVGNGTKEKSVVTYSNARTLDWSGNEVLAGKLTVGTGPTANMDVATKQYVDTAIGNVNSFNVSVVSTLPATGDTHTIYFVPQASPSTAHDEYMYINNTWELIGNTQIDTSVFGPKAYMVEIQSDGNDGYEFVNSDDNFTNLQTKLTDGYILFIKYNGAYYTLDSSSNFSLVFNRNTGDLIYTIAIYTENIELSTTSIPKTLYVPMVASQVRGELTTTSNETFTSLISKINSGWNIILVYENINYYLKVQDTQALTFSNNTYLLQQNILWDNTDTISFEEAELVNEELGRIQYVMVSSLPDLEDPNIELPVDLPIYIVEGDGWYKLNNTQDGWEKIHAGFSNYITTTDHTQETPEPNTIYYNTTDNYTYIYDGTNWERIGYIQPTDDITTIYTITESNGTYSISPAVSGMSFELKKLKILKYNNEYYYQRDNTHFATLLDSNKTYREFTLITATLGNVSISSFNTYSAVPTITNTLASGTLIATINGTNIYAPAYTDADGVSY